MVELQTKPLEAVETPLSDQVLGISGMRQLVDTIRLKRGEAAAVSERELLNEAIGRTINQMDAMYSSEFVSHYFSWSNKEKADFFSKRSRQPYNAGIRFAENPNTRYVECVAIGSYLKTEYYQTMEEHPDSGETHAAQNRLIGYIFTATPFLLDERSQALNDRSNGIVRDPETGEAHPSEEIVHLFEKTAKKHSEDRAAEEVSANALSAIEGGNLGAAYPFLKWHEVPDDVKRTLVEAYSKQAANKKLLDKKLDLIIAAEKFRADIGLSFSDFIELLGLPPAGELEATLTSRLTDQEKNERFLRNYQTITGTEYETQSSKTSWDVIHSVARAQRYPAAINGKDEIEQKLNQAVETVKGFMPLFGTESQLTSVIPAKNFGAIRRAVTITYPTANNDHVHVVGVTAEGKGVLDSVGHEGTHVIHDSILKAATKLEQTREGQDPHYDPYITTTFLTIDEGIQEAFALTTQAQMKRYRELHGESVSQEAESIYEFLNDRELAQIGLLQLRLRQAIARQLQRGEMDKKALMDLLRKTELANGTTGIDLPHPGVGLSLFPEDPLDGTKYLLFPSESGEQPLDLALQDKSGKQIWISDPDTRNLFYTAMLESGSGKTMDEIVEYITRSDANDAEIYLHSYGIMTSES